MKFDTLYKIMINEQYEDEAMDTDLGDSIRDELDDADYDPTELLSAQEVLGILPEQEGAGDFDPDDLNGFERKAYATIALEKGYIARIKSGDMTQDEALQRIEDTDYPAYKLHYQETNTGFSGMKTKEIPTERMTSDEAKGLGVTPEIDVDPLTDPDAYYGDQ